MSQIAWIYQTDTADRYQAVSSICLPNARCCMYSLELLMMYGKTVRNMQTVLV